MVGAWDSLDFVIVIENDMVDTLVNNQSLLKKIDKNYEYSDASYVYKVYLELFFSIVFNLY